MSTTSNDISPSSTPSNTPHAPKYGTVIPNRIFVGGIAPNTSDLELKGFFTTYGQVKDTKIIADRAGVSKGYGFVTFESQEDADRILKTECDNLVFKERKLNIGPAIRKQQPFSRVFGDGGCSPAATQTWMIAGGGVPYTFQNGMAFFHPVTPDGSYGVPQAATTQAPPYATQPLMVQPAVYTVTQPASAYGSTYQAPATAQPSWTAGQWRWTPQAAPAPQMSGQGQQYIYAPAAAPPSLQPTTPELMYAQSPPYHPMTSDPAACLDTSQGPEGSMVMDHRLQHTTIVTDHHVPHSATSATTPVHASSHHYTVSAATAALERTQIPADTLAAHSHPTVYHQGVPSYQAAVPGPHPASSYIHYHHRPHAASVPAARQATTPVLHSRAFYKHSPPPGLSGPTLGSPPVSAVARRAGTLALISTPKGTTPRLITKVINGTAINVLSQDGSPTPGTVPMATSSVSPEVEGAPLTPPPTPDVNAKSGSN